MRAKHKNDYNHCKGGFQAGNRRYSRKKPTRKMGRAKESKN